MKALPVYLILLGLLPIAAAFMVIFDLQIREDFITFFSLFGLSPFSSLLGLGELLITIFFLLGLGGFLIIFGLIRSSKVINWEKFDYTSQQIKEIESLPHESKVRRISLYAIIGGTLLMVQGFLYDWDLNCFPIESCFTRESGDFLIFCVGAAFLIFGIVYYLTGKKKKILK